MEYQSPLHKKLHDGVFVFTAETTPPDASNKETLLKKIEPLKDVADAINVTDSPGAKVHMSALTAAIILAQNDIDPILQLTVRDRNRLALQGDLVGASALGVHNILCLSGDDPKVGDQPETKPAQDIDSTTLVATANMMRKDKKFPSGRAIDPPPRLFIGGAEVPSKGKPSTEKILEKIKNGILNINILHTSASLVIQENADPDVLHDLKNFFDKLAPMDNKLYKHTTECKDDMPAHIKSALTNNQLTLSIKDKKLMLGTWQGLYLFEHRLEQHNRTLSHHLIGD